MTNTKFNLIIRIITYSNAHKMSFCMYRE